MRLRVRTLRRTGDGQPARPVTDPDRIRHQPPGRTHSCGECFGPRSASNKRLFCRPCMVKLFGGEYGHILYDQFIRSERQRNVQRAKRRASA